MKWLSSILGKNKKSADNLKNQTPNGIHEKISPNRLSIEIYLENCKKYNLPDKNKNEKDIILIVDQETSFVDNMIKISKNNINAAFCQAIHFTLPYLIPWNEIDRERIQSYSVINNFLRHTFDLNSFEHNPLFHAIEYHDEKNNKIHLINYLLKIGANPNIFDKHRDTLLNFSVNLNRGVQGSLAAIVKLLLEYGANPNLPNNEGKTPLKIASDEQEAYAKNSIVSKHYAEIIESIKSSGKNLVEFMYQYSENTVLKNEAKYITYVAPNEEIAQQFIEFPQILKPNFTLIVDTPLGRIAKDSQGVFKQKNVNFVTWKGNEVSDHYYMSKVIAELIAIGKFDSFLSKNIKTKVRNIGKEIDAVDGHNMMLDVHQLVQKSLNSTQKVRELEMAWDGIGDWKG
jgi:hypothetical protein